MQIDSTQFKTQVLHPLCFSQDVFWLLLNLTNKHKCVYLLRQLSHWIIVEASGPVIVKSCSVIINKTIQAQCLFSSFFKGGLHRLKGNKTSTKTKCHHHYQDTRAKGIHGAPGRQLQYNYCTSTVHVLRPYKIIPQYLSVLDHCTCIELDVSILPVCTQSSEVFWGEDWSDTYMHVLTRVLEEPQKWCRITYNIFLSMLQLFVN